MAIQTPWQYWEHNIQNQDKQSKNKYTIQHRKLSVHAASQSLEEMILYLIYGFCMMTCTVSPLSRLTAHLLLLVMSVEIFTNFTQMNEWGYS